jgi:hypothetical protein
MNRLRPLSIATALVLALAAASAQASPPAATALPAWDQLSPAQRDLVIAPLRDRWNADPQMRARLFQHAQRWQQLTPGQRARMRHGLGKWEHMDPQQRETMRTLFHKMRDLTPEQRTALREQWRKMTAQQRREWVEANRSPAD